MSASELEAMQKQLKAVEQHLELARTRKRDLEQELRELGQKVAAAELATKKNDLALNQMRDQKAAVSVSPPFNPARLSLLPPPALTSIVLWCVSCYRSGWRTSRPRALPRLRTRRPFSSSRQAVQLLPL